MQHGSRALRRWLIDDSEVGERFLGTPEGRVRLLDMRDGTMLGVGRDRFVGRSVLLSLSTQRLAAQALVELDGMARRIVIAPPDLKVSDHAAVMAGADVDAVLTDGDPLTFGPDASGLVLRPARLARADACRDVEDRDTEWVLLTSGTTGTPKMVVHSRSALTGAIVPNAAPSPPVWGTFYDIRRYGGLQILLRAVLCGGSLVLSQAGETVGDHLARLGAAGVTHLSGTPSHWRRVAMSPEAALISPRYVRLSGEIADQAILDMLARTYPDASVGHAYASTEAGVGFEVDDGLEGFPAHYLDPDRPVRMKVEAGSLRIRSDRAASRYLGAAVLRDEDGFVDTDDMVEQRGDRLYFVGRRSGIINVGGLKVHPEEVEAVINRHAGVRMSLVKARANPITGAIVVAEVVPEQALAESDAARQAELKTEILQMCRDALPSHKVPVLLRFATGLAVTAAGKLDRAHA